MRLIALASALAMTLSGVVSAADSPAPDLSLVTPEHKAMLECATVFAVVAYGQAEGDNAALRYPPLGERGKEYFVLASTRVMDEAKLSKEAVSGLLAADAAALQEKTKVSDPDAVVAAAMAPCLPKLDAAVAPLKTPDLLQCSAILQVAYEEVHSREGLSPTAQDLATLASVLRSREHEALIAKGASGDEADRTIAEAHDALLADAFAGGGAGKYDISHCYDLAKPDPKSHY